jgi:trans-aconitate methyltransferase
MSAEFIQDCDNYLGERTGCYDYRRERYAPTVEEMLRIGLSDTDTVYDIGAGMTEFDYCLRTEGHFKGRYIPIDGGIDGTDIQNWIPPRKAEFFVALELLEHLENPHTVVRLMQHFCTKGIIISTPNPWTTDVLMMDRTHKCEIFPKMLEDWGFSWRAASFYGKEADSIFGVWEA